MPTDSGYDKLLARHSGKAADVSAGSGDNGAYLHQWEYVGGGNQQWRVESVGEGYYKIVARHSGKALDVAGVSQANGAGIIQGD